MNIYANKGTKVRYTGSTKEQVNWGGNTNPEGLLEEGVVYTVKHTEVHSYHTKVYLEEVEGKFNSCSFEDIDNED